MIVPASELDYKQRGDKSIGIRRRIDTRHTPLGFGGNRHQRHHRRRHFWVAVESVLPDRVLQLDRVCGLRDRGHPFHFVFRGSWQPF